MARGDARDLFFRELRNAGLSRPAVEALVRRFEALETGGSAGTSPTAWHGPFHVTKDTPDGTPLGLTLAAGSVIHAFYAPGVDFDSLMFVGVLGDDVGAAGSYQITQSASPTIGNGPVWQSDSGLGGMLVLSDSEAVFTSFGNPNTVGDKQVWVLVTASPL